MQGTYTVDVPVGSALFVRVYSPGSRVLQPDTQEFGMLVASSLLPSDILANPLLPAAYAQPDSGTCFSRFRSRMRPEVSVLGMSVEDTIEWLDRKLRGYTIRNLEWDTLFYEHGFRLHYRTIETASSRYPSHLLLAPTKLEVVPD